MSINKAMLEYKVSKLENGNLSNYYLRFVPGERTIFNVMREEPIFLPYHKCELLATGLRISVPKNTAILIYPNLRLIQCDRMIKVIPSIYIPNEELKIGIEHIGDKKASIDADTPIAQLVLVKTPRMGFWR